MAIMIYVTRYERTLRYLMKVSKNPPDYWNEMETNHFLNQVALIASNLDSTMRNDIHHKVGLTRVELRTLLEGDWYPPAEKLQACEDSEPTPYVVFVHVDDDELVKATRWFKNGDHPKDDTIPITVLGEAPYRTEGKVVRYYRHPSISSETECEICGLKMHDHGWLDPATNDIGMNVCPGDWVLTRPDGNRRAVAHFIFEQQFKEVAAIQ